jgi:hypothetical protein
MFDERERAFEAIFAHQEELRFRALTRRNILVARWVAEQIDLRGGERTAYLRRFAESAALGDGEATLVDRLLHDLISNGVVVREDDVRQALTRAAAAAAHELQNGAAEPA